MMFKMMFSTLLFCAFLLSTNCESEQSSSCSAKDLQNPGQGYMEHAKVCADVIYWRLRDVADICTVAFIENEYGNAISKFASRLLNTAQDYIPDTSKIHESDIVRKAINYAGSLGRSVKRSSEALLRTFEDVREIFATEFSENLGKISSNKDTTTRRNNDENAPVNSGMLKKRQEKQGSAAKNDAQENTVAIIMDTGNALAPVQA